MEQINKVIHEALNGLTTSGINRFRYIPYDMEIALSVVERIGRSIIPDFKLTSEAKNIYQELIRYFHGDPDFKGELTKGILLMGPTGTGKTLAMQIMSIYRQIDDIKFIINGVIYRMNYEIIDVNMLVSYFLTSAFDGIDIYGRRYIICLDDIGTESEHVKHYGNTLDVVSHVLAERYSKRLLTFGTTNFPISTLEEKYDDRVISRMYALFNFIEMKGNDFRRSWKQ